MNFTALQQLASLVRTSNSPEAHERRIGISTTSATLTLVQIRTGANPIPATSHSPSSHHLSIRPTSFVRGTSLWKKYGVELIFNLFGPTNMASSCPSISRSNIEPLLNVSVMLWQRWEDSPKDDRKRLELCWGYTDCGDCHRSIGFCGWCAIVSAVYFNASGSQWTSPLFILKIHAILPLILCYAPHPIRSPAIGP